ncbi:glycosyl hydrolase 115 family protein [Flavobacterium sp.]|uniref:glycosyl hydrolase 115 family protein n=1 Tax=Flavobacterium sp. TaxID=239 RepID=UPI003C52F39B
MRLFTLLAIVNFSFSLNANAQKLLIEKYTKQDFILFNNGKTASILYDKNDHKVIEISANLFSEDLKAVCGTSPKTFTSKKDAKGDLVIIGSLDKSSIIKQLVKNNAIDTTGMTGVWEKYSIQTINNPWQRGKKIVVIFGSDRRGTAFGVLELSKQMGVSPWYWWADVPVVKKDKVFVKGGIHKSSSPDVKYRGIFINDEDWGMKPWSTKTFEPELGDIGPKTYAKVFELLLRLKANYLWPAMHECSGAFNKYTENKVIADKYAIVMGSSHCEPVLFNNATEWDKKNMGEWNYATNREGICKVLDKRVSENAPYENVYTIGIRGVHDHKMEGGFSVDKQIELVKEAINDQRDILKKHIGKNAEEIPQIFVPYAEVLHLYNNGLKVPDDITLMWVDDNYGYMRRLSDPIEQQRSGGSGVYYHISYLGNPHEYTWLSTTNPALIYQEMKKAYDYKANRVWMVNVGDIKPAEYNTTFFLDLAWNIDTVKHENVYTHMQMWYNQAFGEKLGAACNDLMYDFYQINFVHKPEFMGWGEEFSSDRWRERIEDTDFSFTNYKETERRLEKFKELSQKVTKLRKQVPESHQAAFFELVYYPIMGAHYINHKLLLAHKNRWYTKLGHAATNDLVVKLKAYNDSIRMITHEYELLLGGKWKGMMSEVQSGGATFAFMPPFEEIKLPKKAGLGILVEEYTEVNGINKPYYLPVFTSHYNETYTIDVFNTGQEALTWEAIASADWISISQTSGTTSKEQRLQVSVDWNKLQGKTPNGTITIRGAGAEKIVFVKAFYSKITIADKLKGVFVEKNGYISIPLEDYHRKVDKDDVNWIVKKGLGVTGASLATQNNHSKSVGHWAKNDKYAHVEYDFYTFNSGRFDISTYVLPTYPINGFELHRFAISVDEESPKMIYVGADIDSDSWRQNVRRNSSIHTSSHYITKPGKHTLKIYYMDPGVVVDKAVLNFGGLKNSYLGPETTQIK